ncbi:MAG: DUF4252 domain-containing protein [Xanthomonadales bacterium]|nr:DUF4252 domain-containing protein [Xanthomonadales bacterium]
MKPALNPFPGAFRTVVCATVLVFMLSACGITAPRYNEGFANLDSPGMAETDRTMSLSLGPTVLRFAARFLDDDPETQALLRSLDGVRVRIYEVYGDHEKITQNFERMGHKLGDDGWTPVMLIREEGELVQMYAKESDSGVRGLTIVSADNDEVVVVNIMGDIDPARYGDVMMALDVEAAPNARVANVN